MANDDVMFQSTHPRRVRPPGVTPAGAVGAFQSTHPRRVRLFGFLQPLFRVQFQSTHPRRVRPLIAPLCGNRIHVSIHAPAQGATLEQDQFFRVAAVSIHAPAQGATQEANQLRVDDAMFQSTHPRRVRPAATPTTLTMACFNPRTRAGCDRQVLMPTVRPCCGFNPRTRAGCDAAGLQAWRRRHSFNPRTRAGCDSLVVTLQAPRDPVSIHAPAQGATAGAG